MSFWKSRLYYCAPSTCCSILAVDSHLWPVLWFCVFWADGVSVARDGFTTPRFLFQRPNVDVMPIFWVKCNCRLLHSYTHNLPSKNNWATRGRFQCSGDFTESSVMFDLRINSYKSQTRELLTCCKSMEILYEVNELILRFLMFDLWLIKYEHMVEIPSLIPHT